jgi:hypothetical protein
MGCEHKRVKSVNCVIFCMDCGAKLDKAPEPEPEKKPVRKTAKKGETKNEQEHR